MKHIQNDTIPECLTLQEHLKHNDGEFI